MTTWICARTHPNAEKIAIRNLVNQDFGYYQPKILERKLIRHRQQLVEQPLFPCYLFIRVDKQYRSLRSTHGIASLVNGIVQNSVIDNLKNNEQNGYIQLPKSRLQIGDKVTINNGLFAGQLALVERMSGSQRQKILLALLANKISVTVDESDCIAA